MLPKLGLRAVIDRKQKFTLKSLSPEAAETDYTHDHEERSSMASLILSNSFKVHDIRHSPGHWRQLRLELTCYWQEQDRAIIIINHVSQALHPNQQISRTQARTVVITRGPLLWWSTPQALQAPTLYLIDARFMTTRAKQSRSCCCDTIGMWRVLQAERLEKYSIP